MPTQINSFLNHKNLHIIKNQAPVINLISLIFGMI